MMSVVALIGMRYDNGHDNYDVCVGLDPVKPFVSMLVLVTDVRDGLNMFRDVRDLCDGLGNRDNRGVRDVLDEFGVRNCLDTMTSE